MWLNFFVGCLGALYPELVRIKKAYDLPVTKGAAASRWPWHYFVVTPAFILGSGALTLLFPESTSSFLCFYIGTAGPRVASLIVSTVEPVLPRAIDLLSSHSSPEGANNVSVDDTSAKILGSKPIYRVRGGRFREARGFYRFLTLV